jgi:TetR/AcrR family transcriptional repressor of mexJK operon
MSAPPPVKLGRPRDRDKRLAALDAGWSLFLEHGVSATTVESIAAKAGVSKVTLYKYYPDKPALFRAAVLREMERIEAAQGAHGADDAAAPVADRLRGFGMGIMAFLTSPPAIDFYAAVAGELRRHPDLARAFYDLGPGRTRGNLARLIEGAAARGELVCADPERAAEELFGLWQGLSNFQLSLGIDADALRAELPERVDRGVAVFLRMYGAG